MTALTISSSLFTPPPTFFSTLGRVYDDSAFSKFTGKEKFAVETDNISVTGSRFGGIRDRLRSDSDKYWIETSAGVFMLNKNTDITKHLSFEYEKPESMKQGGKMPSISQRVKLKANKDSAKFSIRYQEAGQDAKAFDFNKWHNYINELSESLSSKVFKDHAYRTTLPYTREQLATKKAAQNPPYFDILPEYNYYIGETETYTGLVETALPMFYVFAVLDKTAQENVDNPQKSEENKEFFRRFSTVNDAFKNRMIFQENGGHRRNQGKIATLSKTRELNSSYFQNFAKAAESDEDPLEEARSRFTNLVFPLEDADILKDYNEKKDLFPMYVELNISSKDNLIFSTAIKDAGLTNAMIQKLLDIERRKEISFNESKLENFYGKTFSIFPDEAKRELTIEKIFDVTEWLTAFQKGDNLVSSEDLNSFSKFIGEHNKTQDIATDDRYKFFRALSTIILQGKFNTLVELYNRSYQDIMDGKVAYSEPFMYKVSKHFLFEDGTVSVEPIQRYYFPNSTEMEVLTFIDTQVKYDVRYRYNIEVFNFVLGSRYRYENFVNQYGSNTAEFDVISEPSLVMIATEYGNLDTIVVDDPPVFPDVEFIPWKGVNDKLNVWILNNLGDYLLEPVFIGDDSAARKAAEKVKLKQKREDKLRYKSDDPILTYEVYRTNERPTSYDDFEGHLLRSLEKQDAYIDSIQPNTKYYYTIRAVDIHGNFSNPSPVFKIEMIDDSGAIYLLVNVVEFASTDIPSKASKKGKRYIQISPAFQQSLINEEKSDLEDAETATNKKINFGTAEESLLGKSIKIRLTSRHTGKQIDFNLSFQKEKTKKT